MKVRDCYVQTCISLSVYLELGLLEQSGIDDSYL